MPRFIIALIFVSPLVLSNISWADDFVAQPGTGTTDIDLDTSFGNFSYWVVPNIGDANAVRSNVQIPYTNGNQPYCGAGVMVIAGKKAAAVNFRSPTNTSTAPLNISLLQYEDKTIVETQKFDSVLHIGQKISFAIDWDSSGVVTITISGKDITEQALSARLEQPPSRIEVISSSCNAKFTPFQIGHSSGASTPPADQSHAASP